MVTDEKDAMLLIAGIVETALSDMSQNRKESCPYAHGGHTVAECGEELIRSLRSFAHSHASVTADEIALEALRLIDYEE